MRRYAFTACQARSVSFALALASAFIATPVLGFAQTPTPFPHPDSLIAISGRGMELAAYDFAVRVASDSVRSLHGTDAETDIYYARREGGEWWVVFGHLTAGRDTFLLSFEARQQRALSDSFSVRDFRPANPEVGVHLRVARAIDLARRTFASSDHPRRPYNVAVLPTDGKEMLVYLYPDRTRPDVWPLGGDVRYRVSEDGQRIMETRRLHKAILEYGTPVLKPGDSPKAGMHVAILHDVPEDTDVLHVMTRRPRVPELIATDAFVYEVYPNGAIHLAGRREDFLKP